MNKMNILKKLALTCVAVTVSALTATAQIATPTVTNDFNSRAKQIGKSKYLEVFKRQLTDEQRQALQVLYAYMPLPDITDNSGDFFLDNVNVTLKARNEMPWGKIVPDREFRHFVIPLRVNNEMLDTARAVFYDELKDRVKGLSMEDAILEVNHWCHEKATYQPSDSRTHNPLATVSSAIGRCGEESTFTVAALRSVGIPARQIYTPRWAHTDDNHAWVEAWANGKWYFLGACEPEPILNLAWFNSPASRGMLMNTRVFGKYDGQEEVLLQLPETTDINTTEIYAPIDTIHVTVTDKTGRLINGATVSYRLYNYAELYPIVTKKSDAKGNSSLTTGLGDLVIWASYGKDFGFKKASVGKDHHVTVKLDMTPESTGSYDFNIVPPQPSDNPIAATPEAIAQNDIRKAYEDSIRTAYTATFFDAERASALAKKFNADISRMQNIMINARGNHKTIEAFLQNIPAGKMTRALDFLESLSAKDMSDVTIDILNDHFYGSDSNDIAFVVNPRISDEPLTPYRNYFKKAMPQKDAKKFQANPDELVKWTASNINVESDWNPVALKMSPMAVWNHRRTNATSRNHFFVAMARSLDIPARIDPVTGKTQWRKGTDKWNDAVFEKSNVDAASNAQGTLMLSYEKVGRIDNPRYYTNFTISKITDGQLSLLGYDEDATWLNTFEKGVSLDEGQYILVSGQRMADGTVLAHIEIFEIKANATTSVKLNIRQSDNGVQVIGNFNSENIYRDLATGTDKSILSTTGRGYYVIGLITPNHEPTNHALRDIAALTQEFEKWGKNIVLLFKDEKEAARYDASQLPKLPSTVVMGADINGAIANEISEAMKLTSTDRPIFLIADTFNRVVFIIQGYTIGLGDQLIDTIHKLKE